MDIYSVNAKAMCLAFLDASFRTDRAYQTPDNPKVVVLGQQISQKILLGRRIENNTPIIALPTDMTPWFFGLDHVRVGRCKAGKIHFCIGAGRAEFALTIESRQSRSVMIPESHSSIDLYSYTSQKQGVFLSRPITRVPFVEIDTIHDLIPREETSILQIETGVDLSFKFDILDPNNFKHISEQLAEGL